MKTKKIVFLAEVAAIAVIMLASCGHGDTKDQCALPNTYGFKSFPTSFSLNSPEIVDLHLPAVSYIQVFDSVLFVFSPDPQGAIAAFTLPSCTKLGQFMKKGNGPGEYLFQPHELFCMKEDGIMKGILYMKGRGTALTLDLDASFRSAYPVVLSEEKITDSDNGLIMIPLSSSLFMGIQRSDDQTQMLRFLIDDGNRFCPTPMEYLNASRVYEANTGFDFNVLLTNPAYHPGLHRIAETSYVLNTVHVYDVSPSGKVMNTSYYGPKISSIRDVETTFKPQNLGNRRLEYLVTRSYDSFFAALYQGATEMEIESGRMPMPSIHFFDWNGIPRLELKLSVNATSFDIDMVHGDLYVREASEGAVYRYPIAPYLSSLEFN